MNDILEKIKSAPHEQIPDLAHDKFVQVYSQKFGEEEAETFFEQQKNLFIGEMQAGSYAQKLATADAMSIYFAFINLAINGLSLEKGSSTTCYLEAKSVKIGEDPKQRDKYGNPLAIYQNSAVITITGYGEIILRQRAGQITSVDSPKVVYDCDSLRFGERDGKSFLEYEKCIPRPKGSKVIACYVRIIKKDKSVDYFVLDTDEMIRLRGYCSKQNGGRYINPLYGKQDDCSDIDTGFLKSKTIKHAFKGYPKLPIGSGATLEADKDLDPVENQPTEPENTAPANGVSVQSDDNDPFNQ